MMDRAIVGAGEGAVGRQAFDRRDRADTNQPSSELRRQTVRFLEGVAPRHGRERRYRPDVDGLRALAVIPVVLFHLDVGWVRGGFVGVDIFFVISGYLITQILQAELGQGRFSIVAFYDRRIRRVFPALFAVMLATLVAAPILLLPPEIADLGRSMIATTLFASNMYFLAVTDYFNSAASVNPLLHTWSLAVEEQFYVIFPVLLYLLRHAPRRVLQASLALLGLSSFALSVFLVHSNQTAAFYLAPSRAWELLLGALVALDVLPLLRKPWLSELAAWCGLALILVALSLFYANMPFPGVRALLPCIGAACLIYAGETGSTVSRWLSWKPVVFIGLVSYSLYLWHWPIIVLTRLWWVAPLGAAGTTLLFLASVVAGIASWWFIERPFRIRRALATANALRWSALGVSVGTLVVAGYLVASGGLKALFPPDVDRLAGYLHYDDRAAYRRGTCFLDSHADALDRFDRKTCLAAPAGKPRLLLVGDSHAAHLWSGLQTQMPDTSVLQATASGCKPVFGGKGAATCRAIVDEAFNLALAAPGVDAVVLSARWDAEDIPALLATIDRLAPRVSKIYVAGPIVEYRESLPRLLSLGVLDRSSDLLSIGRVSEKRDVDQTLETSLSGRGATYLSAYRALCPDVNGSCITTAADGTPVQWDYGHLTASGSAAVVEAWLNKRQLKSPGPL